MLSTMNRKSLRDRPCASMTETHAGRVVPQRSKDGGCFGLGAVGRRDCAWKVGRRVCAPRKGSFSTKGSAESEWGLPMNLAGETEAADRLFSGHFCAEFPPRLGKMCGSRSEVRALPEDRARSEFPALGAGLPVREHGKASRLSLPCNNQIQGTPPSYLPSVVTLPAVVRGTSRGGSWGAPEACRYTAFTDGALR